MSQKAQRNAKLNHEYLKGKDLWDEESHVAIQSQIRKIHFLWSWFVVQRHSNTTALIQLYSKSCFFHIFSKLFGLFSLSIS